MYGKKQTGNTIIRKEIRQHKNNAIRQQISTYLIPVNKDFSSIDTKFFTASNFSFFIFLSLLPHLGIPFVNLLLKSI